MAGGDLTCAHFGPAFGPPDPPFPTPPRPTVRPPQQQPKGTTMTNRPNLNDKGQTAVEYLGIIAVVVAIVLAITGTDIGQTIFDAITEQIAEVTG